MPLGEAASATLVVGPPAGASFGREAELVARAATDVIQVWLAGAQGRLQDAGADVTGSGGSEFVVRIEEELERAKRFDLRLSLVVVHFPERAPISMPRRRLQDAVRQELRGSDVLGTMNGDRVAALLTHTDGAGIEQGRRTPAPSAGRGGQTTQADRRDRRSRGIFAGVPDRRRAALAGGQGCATGFRMTHQRQPGRRQREAEDR